MRRPQRAWVIFCGVCLRRFGPDLVACQEHLMDEHDGSPAEFRSAVLTRFPWSSLPENVQHRFAAVGGAAGLLAFWARTTRRYLYLAIPGPSENPPSRSGGETPMKQPKILFRKFLIVEREAGGPTGEFNVMVETPEGKTMTRQVRGADAAKLHACILDCVSRLLG